MGKTTTTITIDTELFGKLSQMKVNKSAVCNKALWELVNKAQPQEQPTAKDKSGAEFVAEALDEAQAKMEAQAKATKESRVSWFEAESNNLKRVVGYNLAPKEQLIEDFLKAATRRGLEREAQEVINSLPKEEKQGN